MSQMSKYGLNPENSKKFKEFRVITEASMTVGDDTLDRKNNESKSMLQVYNSKSNLLTNSVESPTKRNGTLKLTKKGKARK